MVVVVPLVEDVVVEDVVEGAGEIPVVVSTVVDAESVECEGAVESEGAESVECGDAVVGTFNGRLISEYDSILNDVRL